MIELLTVPFFTSILLVIIHVYFGSFVLKRGIIFIDLALAQWAALGYLLGHAIGIESPLALFTLGFGFTLIAAVGLTLLKPIFDKVNLQEAVIGVIYIMASTIAIVIISTIGMEGHHLTDMLAGHLLFVQLPELLAATGLYAIIGVIVYRLHQHFLQPTCRLFDFIFYALFGLVVTSSVKMVGILLVFSFLVIPILSVTLFTKQFKPQVTIGWLIGSLSSLIGLWVAIIMDIPPSFAIILVLIVAWVGSVALAVTKRNH